MRVRRSIVCLAILAVAVFARPAAADDMVPFGGTWTGSTVSAIPDPGGEPAFLVVSEGFGNATQLGRFFMSSPHLSYLADLRIIGEQNFTAANGDTLFATIEGQLAGFGAPPQPIVTGTLTGTITGGTGRFEGAAGTYDFHIIATWNGNGYDSIAAIEGEISSVGSTKAQ